jgi:para-nitrobenzyl esterase
MTRTSETVDVETTSGTVRGIRRAGSAAFLGIPFAEPPVGELRFAAPTSHRRWTSVHDATAYGATPLRTRTHFTSRIPDPSIAGDSFLVLNVFSPIPEAMSSGGLPVLVYLHGGGFVAGSASSPWYDGAAFARDGVIVVSVSYRLGFDGFGWIDGAVNNRALRDVILALEWVRENVGHFGGDAARVTLVGHSAGGVIGYGLLAAPAASELFQRAWMMSSRPRAMSVDEARTVGHTVAELAGVGPSLADLAAVPARRILELQGEAVACLDGDRNELEVMRAVGDGVMRWGPVIDGELIPSPLRTGLTLGAGAATPLVLGTTDNELNDFADGAHAAVLGRERVLRELGAGDAIAREYAATHSDLGAGDLACQWITDSRYRRQVLALADARAAENDPTWLYRFSWRSPVDGRALHCLDLPFVFDTLHADGVEELAGPKPPQSLADELHGAMVAFATVGDPGWRGFGARKCTKSFDVESTVESDGLRLVRPLADHG